MIVLTVTLAGRATCLNINNSCTITGASLLWAREGLVTAGACEATSSSIHNGVTPTATHWIGTVCNTKNYYEAKNAMVGENVKATCINYCLK